MRPNLGQKVGQRAREGGFVAVLDRGRKIAEGSPGEVQRHPDVIRAYLGTAKERREVAAA